jgi:hypothetical protein
MTVQTELQTALCAGLASGTCTVVVLSIQAGGQTGRRKKRQTTGSVANAEVTLTGASAATPDNTIISNANKAADSSVFGAIRAASASRK